MNHLHVIELTTKARGGSTIQEAAIDAIKLSFEMQADVTFEHNDFTHYVQYAQVKQFVYSICDQRLEIEELKKRGEKVQ